MPLETMLRFRHLLEAHQLMAQMFAAVRDLLSDRDLLVTTGTIVDATLIAAPSATKNATKTRDAEMRPTRKGRSWHFGMQCHIGTDPQGFVHTLTMTDAAPSGSCRRGCTASRKRGMATRPTGKRRIARRTRRWVGST
jgi:IS5 family transposase